MKQAVRQLLGLASRAVGSAPVYLSFSDLQFWPPGAINKFNAARLVRPATPGDHIQCRGCEEYCLRPVQVLDRDGDASAQLVSTCDLLDNVGPFFYPSDAVARWSTSRKLLLEFFRSHCSLETAESDEHFRRIRFRAVDQGGVRRTVVLQLTFQPTVCIGNLTIPLEALIVCDDASISLDKSYFDDCFLASEEPKSGGRAYQSSRNIQESNKLLNEILDERLQVRLDQIALEHPNLNKEQLAVKIAKEKKFPGVSAARILRVTRMPARRAKK